MGGCVNSKLSSGTLTYDHCDMAHNPQYTRTGPPARARGATQSFGFRKPVQPITKARSTRDVGAITEPQILDNRHHVITLGHGTSTVINGETVPVIDNERPRTKGPPKTAPNNRFGFGFKGSRPRPDPNSNVYNENARNSCSAHGLSQPAYTKQDANKYNYKQAKRPVSGSVEDVSKTKSLAHGSKPNGVPHRREHGKDVETKGLKESGKSGSTSKLPGSGVKSRGGSHQQNQQNRVSWPSPKIGKHPVLKFDPNQRKKESPLSRAGYYGKWKKNFENKDAVSKKDGDKLKDSSENVTLIVRDDVAKLTNGEASEYHLDAEIERQSPETVKKDVQIVQEEFSQPEESSQEVHSVPPGEETVELAADDIPECNGFEPDFEVTEFPLLESSTPLAEWSGAVHKAQDKEDIKTKRWEAQKPKLPEVLALQEEVRERSGTQTTIDSIECSSVCSLNSDDLMLETEINLDDYSSSLDRSDYRRMRKVSQNSLESESGNVQSLMSKSDGYVQQLVPKPKGLSKSSTSLQRSGSLTRSRGSVKVPERTRSRDSIDSQESSRRDSFNKRSGPQRARGKKKSQKSLATGADSALEELSTLVNNNGPVPRRNRRSSPRDRPASFPGSESDSYVGRPRSSSSPQKPPKEQTQPVEGEEKGAMLEGSQADITAIKTMLLKLRRHLQESDVTSPLETPQSIKNGYRGSEASSPGAAGATAFLFPDRPAPHDLAKDNAELRQQLQMMQFQLEEKDKTIKHLQHQLQRFECAEAIVRENTTSSKWTQTEKVHPRLPVPRGLVRSQSDAEGPISRYRNDFRFRTFQRESAAASKRSQTN